MINEIDIDNKDWYAEKSFPEYPDARTRERLIEIKELGLTEIGIASFGINGVFSGLYIEKVWRFNDVEWRDYIDWVKILKNS